MVLLTSRRTRALLTVAAALVVAFFVLHRLRALEPIETAGRRLVAPLQAGLARTNEGVRSLFASFGSVSKLRDENDRLRDELANAYAEIERLHLDRREAEAVSQALDLLGERAWQGTVARIVGRSPDPTFQLFLINRGRDHGVLPGAAVIVGDGILIGKILESEAESARVLILTDSHTRIAGQIENETRTQGILSGEHGLSLRMDLLEKSDPVASGQLVSTSGLDQGIPAGLLIGRVTSVENRPGDLFQSAAVDPIADLRTLSVVTILTADDA